jgi:predicted RNA-binding Zn-ribbon protein involved in translation (DUF1610 family)
MIFQVRCVCRKELSVDRSSVGRPLRCGACSGSFATVWGIDPQSKKAAPILLETDPSSPRGFKVPLGMFDLGCPCGVHLFARAREAGKRVECPACGFHLKLERSKDPQTLETRIRVVKSRLNQLPSVPSATKPEVEREPQEILCSCGNSFRVEPGAAGNQTQCPACGTQMRIEIIPDSEDSRIVVSPAVAETPKPIEKRGVDEA